MSRPTCCLEHGLPWDYWANQGAAEPTDHRSLAGGHIMPCPITPQRSWTPWGRRLLARQLQGEIR